MRSESGQQVYNELTVEGSNAVVKPLYFSIRGIASMCNNEDSAYKLIAKKIILHAMDYQEPLRQGRLPKNANDDEAIVLSAGFSNLEDQLRKNPDGKKLERQILRPSDISERLDSPSISTFWDSVSEMFSKHPEYLTSNDWFYDLGKEVDQLITGSSYVPPKGRIQISPMEERNFSNGVFFQLRAEMRKINQALSKRVNK